MSANKRKNNYSSANAAPDNAQETAQLVSIPKEAAAPAPQAQQQPPRARSERIGDRLREARLQHNGDLYEIADYLRIKPDFLVALENSTYDKLPADAYVIGFLRTYANFLGLDGKEAIDRYRYEMAGQRKKPTLSMPTPLTEGRMPSGLLMVGATVAILLIYALWYGVSSSNRSEVVTPPPLPTTAAPAGAATDAAAGLTAPLAPGETATTPAAPVAPMTGAPSEPQSSAAPTTSTSLPSNMSASTTLPAEAASGIVVSGTSQAAPMPSAKELTQDNALAPEKTAKDQAKAAAKDKDSAKDALKDTTKDTAKDDKKPSAAPQAAAAGASRLTIRATQSSWVMITDAKGKAVFDRVLKPGESYNVPDQPGLFLTTGNGNGIVLSVNGSDLPKIADGAPHVVRNIALDPDKLAKTSPQ